MINAVCEITLASDTSRKVKVQLNKGETTNSWKTIESSKSGLKLSSASGTWIAPFDFSKTLVLLTGSRIMFVAYKISEDFWTDLTANKTIETDDASLFNGNPSEEKTT